MDLPKWKKPVECKWVFAIKLKADVEEIASAILDGYKAQKKLKAAKNKNTSNEG